MTNGDKIRQMSDEELLIFLCGTNTCVHGTGRCPRKIWSCDECREHWLREEVQEDG